MSINHNVGDLLQASPGYILRGDLEFGLIFSFSETHCEPGCIIDGTVQQVGEMIIASLALP